MTQLLFDCFIVHVRRYAIDTIILTAILQVASFVSNYCWLFWLAVSLYCLQITLHALWIVH